jgi:hypothetical protein
MGPVLKFVAIVAVSAACGTTSRSAAPATAEPELAGVDDKVESNRRVMVRLTEFINTASETLANELISPDAIFFVPRPPVASSPRTTSPRRYGRSTGSSGTTATRPAPRRSAGSAGPPSA